MRILGGHDYYDTALAYGRDETLVFVRSTAEKARTVETASAHLRLPPENTITFRGSHEYLRRSTHTHEDIEYTVYPRILWFAGKRFGAMKVSRYGRGRSSGIMDDLWFWHEDRFAEFMASIDARLREPRKGRYPAESINTASISAFFSEEGREDEIGWLVENRVSIALLTRERWPSDGDPCWRIDSDGLKDIHFQRRVDPYEAFQMLSQWVGGVLPRSGAELVTISGEKTMLSKHGMDKWSFKTPPATAR
jgi:hypothetical protein